MTYRRLGFEERAEIGALLAVDPAMSWSEMGRRLGRHRSTIQREVARCGNRRSYSAGKADRHAHGERRRRVRFRFDDPGLRARTIRLLIAGWSPAMVATKVGVATETVYAGVYSGRLGLDPRDVLRTRPPKRRHRWAKQPPSDGNFLGEYVPIGHRPDHIDTRQRVGDWEGDLISGSKNQSALISLTERRSRYQVVLDLPHGHSADNTIARLHQWLDTRPGPVHSITWDQGGELTRWQQLKDRDIDVYFADPHSPWQRGSVENANRQLRFWFPKGSDLNHVSPTQIDRACHILNHTNRTSLQGQTAHHVFHQTRTKE